MKNRLLQALGYDCLTGRLLTIVCILHHLKPSNTDGVFFFFCISILNLVTYT